jgi:hypothetical protein
MSKGRSVLVGTILLLAMAVPVLLVNLSDRGDGTPEAPGIEGYMTPHEIPFPSAERVSLSRASDLAPFPIPRPDHPLTTEEEVVAVWVQGAGTDRDDASVQVALWYASGLEIHLTPVSPGDEEPLVSDFPQDLPRDLRDDRDDRCASDPTRRALGRPAGFCGTRSRWCVHHHLRVAPGYHGPPTS